MSHPQHETACSQGQRWSVGCPQPSRRRVATPLRRRVRPSGIPRCPFRIHPMPQFGSVPAKKHPLGTFSGPKILFFGLFFAERTQTIFYLTYSWRNRYTFFSWVRLAEKLFLYKTGLTIRSTAPSHRPIQRSLILPIFSHFLKTRYRTLEGLEGLEAFLHCDALIRR